MVFIRSLLPLAALATAVLAAPANVRDLSVGSGGSDCSGSNCGSDSSSSSMSMDCSGGSCDSSSSTMDCSNGGCDSSSSTMSIDCSNGGCDSSSTMSMDCSNGGCDSSSSTMSMDCSNGGCDSSSMTMSMDCSGGSCDSSSMTMTSSAYYSMATYGSGSSNWNQYQSCVQQCIAQYGGSDSSSGSSDSGSGSSDSSNGDLTPTATIGSGGTDGVTHTVIVAPTKGVLRMVPFATEAQVGDTIEFIWGADSHTITKGSALQLCNKSQDSTTFDTGLQNHSFSYLQVVNDTNPVYYFCAHPGHCESGMFGVINPLTTDDPALQAGAAENQTMGDSTMAAMAYAQSAMANGTSSDANNVAQTWGSNYSLKDIPSEMHGAFMENMLYVRSLIAMNPDLVSNGKFKMSTAGAPIMWPTDVAGASNLAAAAPQNAAAAAAPAAASSSSSSAAAAASTTAGKKNGARGLAVSGATVALGLMVSFLAL